MGKNTYIVIIISICLVLVVWFYTEKKIIEKKGGMNTDMFSFGSLDFSTTGTTNILNGCSDPDALNYNSDVTHEDGSCFYVYGCCDTNATNYDASADTCDFADNDLMTCDYGQGIGVAVPETSGFGSGWGLFSDIRLKENINKIGLSPSGIPIYSFNYINGKDLYSGVMAQDLIKLGYQNSISIVDNYYMVDYSKIDVKMKKLN